MTEKEKKYCDLEEDELETEEEISESIEEKIHTENVKTSRKLDYTLESPKERIALVDKIVNETPPEQLTHKYLEILADYIVFAMDKEERKKKHIVTDNRMVTINKRETSFEGLISKFENGEDGIYNMIANDKNIIFTPKISITPKDLEEIEPLRELKKAIDAVEKAQK